jgi:hypothetical protein
LHSVYLWTGLLLLSWWYDTETLNRSWRSLTLRFSSWDWHGLSYLTNQNFGRA